MRDIKGESVSRGKRQRERETANDKIKGKRENLAFTKTILDVRTMLSHFPTPSGWR